MSICTRCERTREPEAFRRGRRVCLECEREYDRTRYAQDSVKRNEHVKRWRAEHAEEQRAYEQRRRALKKLVTVTPITGASLRARASMFSHCYLCDQRLDSDVHLDHVKPLKHGGPHMLSNLRPVHALCNLVKSSRWMGISRYAILLEHVKDRIRALMEDT